MGICIEARNLSKMFTSPKRYREIFIHPFKKKYTKVLNNISIKIKKGELYGLLGPNGAGKTTLIKILCTLIHPTTGTAYINGMDITKQGEKIKNEIGYVLSDERSFYWRLTGKQNLKFFAGLNNICGKEAEKRIENLMEFLDLSENAGQMFKDYSTGMRRKLAIARGLIHEPKIIFMDEPTSGLDPVITQKMKQLIKEKLVRQENKTVIFATHNLHEAEELCDSIAVIDKGKIITEGSIEQIKFSYNPFKSYLIGLKDFDHTLLKNIQEVKNVKKVKPISCGLSPSTYTIEIELFNNNGDDHKLLQEIIGIGCKVTLFCEKQNSLDNLFSTILDVEKDLI
jgi:ABC-2 type transport system ATP-binding protein